jgi:lipopolysaccharide transport system ATP-binding protein
MSMMPAISVDGLSKRYFIGHQRQGRYIALRDVLADKVKRSLAKLRPGPDKKYGDDALEEFWALKDVGFTINQGDRVGVIGRNGAGKSTLLKVLSRITEPTTGRIKIKGRIASLLEVGTGFHPELTGRENIFLNGAILGMSKNEIRRKFDEIVTFAGVEKFLDTPVKHYSSGMYVRLAFSVAAHLESEILIVDEVLAVGDANFQKKCLGKMEEVGQDGRTVFFVSHNMAMISNLCQKGLVLDQGKLMFQGDMSQAVLAYYQANLNAETGENYSDHKYESENAKLLSVGLVRSNGHGQLTIHDDVIIRMKYRLKKSIDGPCVPNFHVYRSDGVCVFVVSPENMNSMPPGDYYADCKIPRDFLNDGAYFVGTAITSFFRSHYVDEYFDTNALMFNVVDPMLEGSSRYGYAGPMPGVIRPKLQWDIGRL